MERPKQVEPKPSERFLDAMKKIIAVPKSELVRREAEYKRERVKSGESGQRQAR